MLNGSTPNQLKTGRMQDRARKTGNGKLHWRRGLTENGETGKRRNDLYRENVAENGKTEKVPGADNGETGSGKRETVTPLELTWGTLGTHLPPTWHPLCTHLAPTWHPLSTHLAPTRHPLGTHSAPFNSIWFRFDFVWVRFSFDLVSFEFPLVSLRFRSGFVWVRFG